MRGFWARALCGLLAGAAMQLASQLAAAQRSNNKSAATIGITITDDGYPYYGDFLLFGVRLAVQEINNRTDILQDVTLVTHRFTYSLGATHVAKTYDDGVTNCDNGMQMLFGGFMDTSTSDYTALVCPTTPIYSLTTASVKISNKKLFPLAMRLNTSPVLMAQAFGALCKYFNWKNIAYIYAFPPSTEMVVYTLQYLPSIGINVAASVRIYDYSSAISQMYYPQLKNAFDFLKSTKLRIFSAFVNPTRVLDIMMAANRTGLVGANYFWPFSQQSIVNDPTTQARWDVPIDTSVLYGVGMFTPLSNFSATMPVFTAELPSFRAFLNYSVNSPTEMAYYHDKPPTTAGRLGYFAGNPPANTLPQRSSLPGYDMAYVLANLWEQIIVAQGSTGQALASGQLNQYITLDKIIASIASTPSMQNAYQMLPTGDYASIGFAFNQYDGTTVTTNSFRSGVFTPNSDGTFVFMPNASKFIWGSRNQSFSNVPIDLVPQAVDYVTFNTPGVMPILYLSLVIGVYCFLSGGIIGWYRAASPTLYYIGYGAGFSLLHNLTLIGQSKTLGCTLRPWPISIGISLALSCMFVKQLLCFKIFHFWKGNIITDTLEKLRGDMIMIIVVVLVLIVTIPLVIISGAYPAVSAVVYQDESDTDIWTCTYSNATTVLNGFIMALIVLISCVTIFLAHKNRHIAAHVNDTRETAVAIASILILSGICILQSSGSTVTLVSRQYFFEAVCVMAGAFMVNTVMVGPVVGKFLLLKLVKSGGRAGLNVFKTTTSSADDEKTNAGTLQSRITNFVKGSGSDRRDSSSNRRSSVASPKKRANMAAHSLENKKVSIKIETEPIGDRDSPRSIRRNTEAGCAVRLRAFRLVGSVARQWRVASLVLFRSPMSMIQCRLEESIETMFLPLNTITSIKVETMPIMAGLVHGRCIIKHADKILVLEVNGKILSAMRVFADDVARVVLQLHRDPGNQLSSIGKDYLISSLEVTVAEKS